VAASKGEEEVVRGRWFEVSSAGPFGVGFALADSWHVDDLLKAGRATFDRSLGV